MSDFDNYPYNEQHELNLDGSLETLKEDDKELKELENSSTQDVENRINTDNAKLDGADKKASEIDTKNTSNENKVSDDEKKADDLNKKNIENKSNTENLVLDANYISNLTEEEEKESIPVGSLNTMKVNGVNHVEQVKTLRPSGVLGNCVIWASNPFTGYSLDEGRTITNQNIPNGTIVQYSRAVS